MVSGTHQNNSTERDWRVKPYVITYVRILAGGERERKRVAGRTRKRKGEDARYTP